MTRTTTDNLLAGMIIPASTLFAKRGVARMASGMGHTKTILPPPWGRGGGRTKGGKRPEFATVYMIQESS
jgi:hypothetical protein